jgi:ribosomal protein S30
MESVGRATASAVREQEPKIKAKEEKTPPPETKDTEKTASITEQEKPALRVA